MWIIYACVAMLGSFSWYLIPKIFPTENLFSSLFWASIFSLVPLALLSRFFYATYPQFSDWKFGAAFLITYLSTIGLVLSVQAGGKIGPIAVIIEISVLLAALVGLFFFKESLNNWQWLGILLTLVGVGLVVYFEK